MRSKYLRHDAAIGKGLIRSAAFFALVLAGGLISTPISGQGTLPVFPGAEGFGTTTPAGRGGVVLRVTNLNDSGPGSLREALSASGPRVVVFETSGTITLTTNDLFIDNPFVTVAGQTAPSPGITIRGGGIRVRTHDVLIQHLRIRPGDVLASGVYRGNAGAIVALGSGTSPSTSNTYNLVFDHVTASWATDQNISTWGALRDVTFSNSLISEGLRDYLAQNAGQCHSCGPLLGADAHRVALVRNVMAHHINRHPTQDANTITAIINNVIYNSQAEVMDFYDYNNEGPTLTSIIGNVQINGPNTPVAPSYVYPMIYMNANLTSGSKFYIADNVAPRVLSNNVSSFNPIVTSPPVAPQVTVRPSSEVEAYLKPRVGARPADRDAVDARVISSVSSRGGRIINAPSEVGGYPSLAVNRRSLTVPANPNGDDDGDGYTNLEEWLHAFSAAVEGRSDAPAPPTNLRILR